MNESMLKSFLQLIAGLAHFKQDEPVKLIRQYVDGYIERNFGRSMVKKTLLEFDNFLNVTKKGINLTSYLEKACENINKEFSVRQKTLILINIINFYSFSNINMYDITKENILDKISSWLKINPNEYLCLKHFVANQLHLIPQKNNLLIVANENPNISGIRHLKSDGLNGFLIFLFLPEANILLFSYNGTSVIELNGKPIYSKNNYIFSIGLIITGKGIGSIYYGRIIKAIIQSNINEGICLSANNVSYNYSGSDKGVFNISLTAYSGEIIGIMGGSGAGKSTFLKLLSGELKPSKGDIGINGQSISSIKENLKDIVGTLHQEECLVEELTVYENIYFSTKLALGGLTEVEIREKVEAKLYELDLSDCIHNRVGPPGNRQLSGGQRKRLAIAMEIVREPKILFADEPTSGLSSSDADAVMSILKDIALEGKLVVVNIHQPSSDIFKLFDRVIFIDKGGIPIFMGHPVEAILHFKNVTERVDKHSSACDCCGTVKPEQIFEMVEELTINELGQKGANRKFSPNDWHQMYLENLKNPFVTEGISQIPSSTSSIPKPIFQFKAFFLRNLLAKIRNAEFIFFALVLPPLLSVLVSLFLRFSFQAEIGAAGYSLYSNPNIPSFFFISILSALFFGLIVSCEDIIRDKRIISRENGVGLSLKSFYNSKVLLLLVISAIQTILFALPGVAILQVKDSLLTLWLILFLVSILGNLLGLILSSSLKSVVAIYILVPFLIIPQILFSGLVVPFDTLNTKFSTQQYVPLIAEAMPTRWASEALMVRFFMNNSYIKPFFTHNFSESELRFRLLFLIPELNERVHKLAENPANITADDIKLLKSGLKLLFTGSNQSDYLTHFEPWTESSVHKIADLVEASKKTTANSYRRAKHIRDRAIETIYPNTSEGGDFLNKTQNNSHNLSIEGLVRNSHSPMPLVNSGNTYIQKIDPIYQIPTSPFGRSHFFAPYKRLGLILIETYWFNVTILVLFFLFCYICFIYNLIPNAIRRFF